MVGVRSGTAKHNAAAAREQAVIEGHKFIELKLLDAGFDGAQGFQVLQSSVFVDHVKNATTYSFAVTGGPLRFERDESRAGRYCQLLDTEINREVLRSVTDAKVVEIVDEKIRAEILSGGKTVTPPVDPPAVNPAPVDPAAVNPAPVDPVPVTPVPATGKGDRKASLPPEGSPLVKIAE